MKIVLLSLVLGTYIDGSQTAKILGVFPHIGKSHSLFFEPILLALASRGHEVSYITQYPIKIHPPTFKNIDISGSTATPYVNAIPVDVLPHESLNAFATYELAKMGITTCETTFASKPVQDLLKSKEKFDLVFYESFNADCFLGFIHRFNAKSIALSSSAFMPWSGQRFGLPDNPSYIVNHFVGLSDRMNFKERIWNLLNYAVSNIVYSFIHDNANYAIAKKYFGEDLPPLTEIAKNTSLYLVNTHVSLYQARPYPPNIIEVGGLHVSNPGKLSKELQEYLDNAKEGVVYFSLGSTARGASLPPETRDAFVEAFKELPEKVLWKWEDESIPNKPANVKISKWVPQTAVLAHPNVKLFITHGGLMGTLEAIHYGVPMISIPLFGDQPLNVALCSAKGIAVKLSLNSITAETVKSSLHTILRDRSFQERAKKVSQLFHDRPQKPLDTAIYWSEYVIKHKGAHHLQSAAVHLDWPQYLLLDIITFAIIFPVILSVLFCYLCCRRRTKKPKKIQHKKDK